MSQWYEPKSNDFSFSEDGKDLHIYLDSDDFGNVYVSLEIELLKKILKTQKAPS